MKWRVNVSILIIEWGIVVINFYNYLTCKWIINENIEDIGHQVGGSGDSYSYFVP